MGKRIITRSHLRGFEEHLLREEKSAATIEKYLRDARFLCAYMQKQCVTGERLIEFKRSLIEKGYAVRSINSMIASVNSLFGYLGWADCRVKAIRTQRQIYCPEERELTREEFQRLVNTAGKNRNERLQLILQTICGTGIRVSELQYITVEAASRGEAVVNCKAKTRTVFIIRELKRLLLQYAKRKGITKGPIFITRTGKAMNRTNVWREMKQLCEEAAVNPRKVFPHNLRHLFARTFYSLRRDIARLADVLGHSSIDTTRIYIISSGLEHRQLMEQMRLVT